VLIVLGTLFVTIPLILAGYRTVMDASATNKATTVVQEWLQGTTDQIVTVSVNGQMISVSIEGSDPLKSVSELAGQLEKELQHPVTVSLRVIPTKIEVTQSRSSP
jgi:hypothetical protein